MATPQQRPTIESEPFQRFCYAGKLIDQYLRKSPLTGVQARILGYLQEGRTVDDIADLLDLSEKHRYRVVRHMIEMRSKGWREEMKPTEETR